MDPVIVSIIASLSAGLFERYKADTPEADRPDLTDLQRVLLKLVDLEKLPADSIKGATDAAFAKIESVVQVLRKDLRLPAGTKILQDFIRALQLSCPTVPGVNSAKVSVTPDSTNPKVITYTEKCFAYWAPPQSFPAVDGDNTGTVARQCFVKAWNSWQKKFNIFADDLYLIFKDRDDEAKAKAEESANLLVETVASLPADYLAYTSVGNTPGVAGRKLTMQINGNVTWQSDRFEGTVAHEIGHLLGLNDNPADPTCLMHSFYRGVNEPQGPDIAVAKSLSWPVA